MIFSVMWQLKQLQGQVLQSQQEESVARVWKMQADKIHGDQKLLIAGGKMQQQETLKQTLAQHQQDKDFVTAMQSNKELEIKAAKVQTEAILENKKLDIMKEKQDNGKSGSE